MFVGGSFLTAFLFDSRMISGANLEHKKFFKFSFGSMARGREKGGGGEFCEVRGEIWEKLKRFKI